VVKNYLRIVGLLALVSTGLCVCSAPDAGAARVRPKSKVGKVTIAYGNVTGASVVKAAIEITGEPASTLHNAKLETPLSSSPIGTYCILTKHTAAEPNAVIVSPINPPFDSRTPGNAPPVVIPYAAWVQGASDCSSSRQVEVRTFEFSSEPGGGLLESPSGYVSFSFVIYETSTK
jgi:hypothetical protein